MTTSKKLEFQACLLLMLWTCCSIKGELSSNIANGWGVPNGAKPGGVPGNHGDNNNHWNSNSKLNQGWRDEIPISGIHNKQQQWDNLKASPPSSHLPSWNHGKQVSNEWTSWQTEVQQNYKSEFSSDREGFSSGWKSGGAYSTKRIPTTVGNGNKYAQASNDLGIWKIWQDSGSSNGYEKQLPSYDTGVTGQGWSGSKTHSDQNNFNGKGNSQRYQQGWATNNNDGDLDNTILEWWDDSDSDTNPGWSPNTDQVWNTDSSSGVPDTKQEGWLSHSTSTTNQNNVQQKGHNGLFRGGWRPQNEQQGGGWRPQSDQQGGGWRPQSDQQGGGWRPQNDHQGGGRGPENGGLGGGRGPENSGLGGGRVPENGGLGGGRGPENSGLGVGSRPQNDQQGISGPSGSLTSTASCPGSRLGSGRVCNSQASVALSSVRPNAIATAATTPFTSTGIPQLGAGQSVPPQMPFGGTMPTSVPPNFTNAPILQQQQFSPIPFAPPRRPCPRRISLLEALIRSKIRFLNSLTS